LTVYFFTLFILYYNGMFKVMVSKHLRTITTTTTYVRACVCVRACVRVRTCYQKALISEYADIISLNLNHASSVCSVNLIGL